MGWHRLLWLALPLFALGEVAVRTVLASWAPPEEDLEAAANEVREGYREGDLVLVAPWWYADARRALGSRVLPLRDQARPDDETFERLWVVAARGARLPRERRMEPERARRHGAVVVRRYRLTPSSRVAYDMTERFRDALVTRGPADRESPCRRVGARWRCADHPGRDEWVGTETISDLDHQPRRCIWAHPLPDSEPLRIRFPAVPSAERIVGYAATDYVVGRHLGPDPVELSVEVGGSVAHRLVHHDRDGWQRFEVELDDRRDPGPVTFVVSAPRSRGRHFCFAAQARAPR